MVKKVVFYKKDKNDSILIVPGFYDVTKMRDTSCRTCLQDALIYAWKLTRQAFNFRTFIPGAAVPFIVYTSLPVYADSYNTA